MDLRERKARLEAMGADINCGHIGGQGMIADGGDLPAIEPNSEWCVVTMPDGREFEVEGRPSTLTALEDVFTMAEDALGLDP